MKLMKRKVPLVLLLVCVGLLSLPYILRVVNRVNYEIHLANIYRQCNQYYTGMSLMDFYEITGSEVRPDVRIELNRKDSSYHHYIYYPPPFNKEMYFKFEFDPQQLIITEKYLPGSCSAQ